MIEYSHSSSCLVVASAIKQRYYGQKRGLGVTGDERKENNIQEPADNGESETPDSRRLYTMMVMVLSCIIVVVDNSIVAAWLLCPRSCFVTRSPDHDSQRHHRRHHCQLMDLLDCLKPLNEIIRGSYDK
ncbi:hypothetical protein KQX54_005070 [Cotesia glomerata]|uniref:Uncharacterized protein n=1 Tax=Cotesia glomerata TaxID=32391 RepID=A0AAV7I8C6_COTGL|nr:hypothetical protein KQX54_005070 [Cotesia glomerata]